MTSPVTGSGGPTGPDAGWIGSLAHTPFAEVLRRIALEDLSGDLQVTSPSAIKTVYFDRGFVVFASSDLKSDRLGESMTEAGRISPHEFALASMLMKTTRQKFGKVLVEAGIVSEEELGPHVAAQVNRIVLSLFSEKRGMYSFDERPCSIPMELMVSLSVYRILIEGIRRMTGKELVLGGLPSLDTDVHIVDRPPFTLDFDKLRPAEKAVLKSVRDGASIRQITKAVGGNEGVALRACYGLLSAGILEASISEAPKRSLPVQVETGTFVLSEIRRKAGVPETPVVTPPPVAVEPWPRATTVAPPAETTPPPRPTPEPQRPVTTPKPGIGASGVDDDDDAEERTPLAILLEWATHLWNRLVSWFDRSSEPSESPVPIQAPLETEPHAFESVPKEPPAPVTAEEATASRQPQPAPTEHETVGVPSWSVRDEPDEVQTPTVPGEGPSARESATVPSWSMTDDPSEQFRDFHEEQRAEAEQDSPPAVETLGVPSWSRMELPRDWQEQPDDSEPELPDSTLATTDNELFVEEEVSRGEETSMLSQIPVEEVSVDEESFELEIEIDEEAFSEVPDPVEEQPTPRVSEPGPEPEPEPVSEPEPETIALAPRVEQPPPVEALAPSVAASEPPRPAQPMPEAQEEEPQEEVSREQAMRRMKQGGGEERLVRDVKLHFRMRDWEGAVPLLRQLVEIAPGKALYRGMLGRAMSRHPILRKDAEEHFLEALRLSPQDPELHYWLGIYYKFFRLEVASDCRVPHHASYRPAARRRPEAVDRRKKGRCFGLRDQEDLRLITRGAVPRSDRVRMPCAPGNSRKRNR